MAMDPDSIVAIVGTLAIFSIPLSAIWTYHRRKVLEMQMRLRSEGDTNVRAAIEGLREEVRALRDTTTQYDLSFDTALQRMERRVENLEQRVNATDPSEVVKVRPGS